MTARLATLLMLAIAAPALAQTRHNTSAPIDFNAGYIELQDRANRAILSGDVNVRQAEMTLTAQRMTVNYTGQVVDGSPQVSRLDASGGVTVTRPDQRARSQYAIYDLNRRVITMLGGVSLAQGSNVVNGGRLTINLDTGRATIDGSAVGGTVRAPDGGSVTTQGGRVTGRFSVPKRD
ncbi:lipopolysaccharide export system protein LptA [Sphingomonas guangdongensis]|uniref:Lipopolysaccharide export system protein LptA n=1 Tax=Sphingomonas guangdongensis TaxID=1141890 RepID=A0A285QEI5_9SPHN|nr:LptA/OstA family protein [Sphingomonas guangdongensis]SOB79894.1 lipopolysaccharide export system protein LptA [Sphingomonas guangdongensis]